MNKTRQRIGCGCLPLLAVIAAGWWAANRFDREYATARPIVGKSAQAAFWDNSFIPQPLPGAPATFAPLAPDGKASIHGDAWQSDAHPFPAPTGTAIEVRSRRAGNWLTRMCPTFTFRSDGKLVAMCGGLFGFRMVLVDPTSLTMLARYELPMRPSSFQAIVHADMDRMMKDSSGGAYFVLDSKDRVLLADAKKQVQLLAARPDGNGGWRFVAERSWDLRKAVPDDCQNWNNWSPRGECDMITTVIPDIGGKYWWTTRYGRIGTLDPASGAVRQIRLPGEEIQNSTAVDDRALYVVTDHAQYAFRIGTDGTPQMWWRETYDRGSVGKIGGGSNQGSGTTPTLLGDYVAITDNADERMHVVVMRRHDLSPGQKRTVCAVPVFGKGGATDNSLIGWGNSLIVENNGGYRNAYKQTNWNAVQGGVARIDIRGDGSGCDVVWTSPLKVPSVVPKLSVPTGIAYFYTYDPAPGGDQDWAIAGLDFRTGKLVQKIATGRGRAWNNNWASLAIGPDGSLYAGVLGGMVQVRQMR